MISLTPFWAIPTMIISVQLGWTFKKRAKKKSFKMSVVCFCIATAAMIFFALAGTPSKAVRKMSDTLDTFEN